MSGRRKRNVRRTRFRNGFNAQYDENTCTLHIWTFRNGVRHDVALELGRSEYHYAAYLARECRKHVAAATTRLRDSVERAEKTLAGLGGQA